MITNINRRAALGAIAILGISTLGGAGMSTAEASSKTSKDLMIGAAAVAGYGLLKHNNTATIVGLAGAALAYKSYQNSKQREADNASYGRNNNYAYNGYALPTSYSGVVTQNFSGNQFQVGLDQGGYLRVAAGDGQIGNPAIGERVNVQGFFNNDNSLFIANDVSVQRYRAADRNFGRDRDHRDRRDNDRDYRIR